MIFLQAKIVHFFKTRPLILKVVAVSLITHLMVSSLFFWMGSPAKKEREVVTIDLIKIMDDYAAHAVKIMHDPVNMKKSARAFSKKLEEVIAMNAREKHLVIMPKQAVIQGAQDITPQIEQIVFGKMGATP